MTLEACLGRTARLRRYKTGPGNYSGNHHRRQPEAFHFLGRTLRAILIPYSGRPKQKCRHLWPRPMPLNAAVRALLDVRWNGRATSQARPVLFGATGICVASNWEVKRGRLWRHDAGKHRTSDFTLRGAATSFAVAGVAATGVAAILGVAGLQESHTRGRRARGTPAGRSELPCGTCTMAKLRAAETAPRTKIAPSKAP